MFLLVSSVVVCQDEIPRMKQQQWMHQYIQFIWRPSHVPNCAPAMSLSLAFVPVTGATLGVNGSHACPIEFEYASQSMCSWSTTHLITLPTSWGWTRYSQIQWSRVRVCWACSEVITKAAWFMSGTSLINTSFPPHACHFAFSQVLKFFSLRIGLSCAGRLHWKWSLCSHYRSCKLGHETNCKYSVLFGDV
jgi:hypothetical protein